tara:strand:+ start:129 stop:830 length:702 start_codon:yes stop_codon:yes gene_type:complete
MELICDYRESALISKLEKNELNIDIKKKNLNLGDFIIGNIIIERKTCQDLACSLLDGRYKEQSNRLIEHKKNNPDIKIIYIIEGNFDILYNVKNITKDTLLSCIVSLICEKDFNVIISKDLNETIKYLLKMTKKYYSLDNNPICNNINYLSNNKKNSQINKENIGELMMSNIPNISINIAGQLLEPFHGDIYLFLENIKKNPEYINSLTIKDKNNKIRKLSKNVKESLLNYLT